METSEMLELNNELDIYIPATEYWDNTDEDETKHHFVDIPEAIIKLEHSLVSLTKWEIKWRKPYLSETEKTQEQKIDYIKCMSLNKVDDIYYSLLTEEQHEQINNYINDPMTATFFYNREKKFGKKEIVTNEVIYSWLVALQIPFEVQHWHLSRLLTLVQVVNDKNTPKKKRSKSDVLKEQYAQNEARLAKYNTTG